MKKFLQCSLGSWILCCSSLLAAETTIVELKTLVPEYMEGDLETAITPAPQILELSDKAFAVPSARLVLPKDYAGQPSLQKEFGLLFGDTAKTEGDTACVVFAGLKHDDANWKRIVADAKLAERLAALPVDAAMRGDSYILCSVRGTATSAAMVILYGASPAGDLWALATLRQMVFPGKDGLYVREGTVLDYPKILWRGNKRPQKWEWAYKANATFHFSGASKPNSRFPDSNFQEEYYRLHGSAVTHSEPLAATEAEMDRIVNGDPAPKEGPDNPHRYKGYRSLYERGCRTFIIKFDDVTGALTDAGKKEFGTSEEAYFKALHAYIIGMHKRVKQLGPDTKFYFMPRPYWYNSYELQEYAKRVLAHGPLPKDMGLHVCGPEVTNDNLPTACLKAYRELFGLEGKAIIYDNGIRGGKPMPYSGRDSDVWKEVDAILPERGTPFSRISSYDFMWNPEAFDANRSISLAVRELSGRDPATYTAMIDFVNYWNNNRVVKQYLSTKEMRAKYATITETMLAKWKVLEPVLASNETAKKFNLAAELFGICDKTDLYEYIRLDRRAKFTPYMQEYGYREIEAIRSDKAVTVDGKGDDAVWSKATPVNGFIKPAWLSEWSKLNRNPEPMEYYKDSTTATPATTMRAAYDETHLYLYLTFTYDKKPATINDFWKGKKPGEFAFFPWRGSGMEFFIDPVGTRDVYYQIITNIAYVGATTHCVEGLPLKSGSYWRPDVKYVFDLGEKSGTMEIAIPIASFGVGMPKPGTAWGLQVFAPFSGTGMLFSGSCDMLGGEHGRAEFGRVIFK